MAKSQKTLIESSKNLKDINFDKGLVLFDYFLKLFKSDNFKELKAYFTNEKLEEINEEKQTGFICNIDVQKLYDDKRISIDKLYEYDSNIVKHTEFINEKRDKKISWKYFQYLTLLFTEIYLDMYFENKENLKNELNKHLDIFIQKNNLNKNTIPSYTTDDLRKLAFWNATGSGKTLILHLNVLQYNHYVKKTGKNKVNKTILLTPNEGLSQQHLQEIKQSGIKAKIFEDSNSFKFEGIEIIDIHKIRKDKTSNTGKTFDISAFGNNNLMLVDEGHRGSSGKEWKSIREQISEDGFVFEYSATFGQAINEGDEELREEYSKCIIFDYSYKYFYNDFYGKDYKILNITDDKDEKKKYTYLTASILSFYQQIKLFKSSNLFNKTFNIEKPLMLFVGASVNSVRTEDKQKVSDVIDILLFLRFFVKEKKQILLYIKNILLNETGILNSKNQDIFINKFHYIASIEYEKIYEEILKEIFNLTTENADMHIENIKKADGEIGIKFGENDYFGLINIGDVSEFIKLCEFHKFNTSANEFDETEFHKINKENSTINILIGSKKFTEGWSSWRVSSIGLMNIGKKQGSQIIQLFGRGVRLKGYNYSLKRSIGLNNLQIKPINIEILETLNIFGIKADYMAEFQKYLQEEGLNIENQTEFIKFPTVINNIYNNKLKVLRVKNGLSFKKDAENITLGKSNILNDFKESLIKRNIILDLYSKAQIIESKETKGTQITKKAVIIPIEILELLDFNRIFFEIEEYKNLKNYYNINVSKKSLKDIFKDNNWYNLYTNDDYSTFSVNDIKKTENIVITLLKKYIERYYNFQKAYWEKDKLEYVFLNEDTKAMKNIVDDYIFEVNTNENGNIIINYLKSLEEEIRKNKQKIDFSKLNINKLINSDVKLIDINNHLYNPLVYINKFSSVIKVKPINLNDGELFFIENLKSYINENNEFFKDKELYLLRNQVGSLGFFDDGNFYPDFIMWLIYNNKQYISFIDPKGMLFENINSSKINLHKTIKEYEKLLNDNNIILNSFIISITSSSLLEIRNIINIEEYNNNNVFFITENDKKTNFDNIKKLFDKIQN